MHNEIKVTEMPYNRIEKESTSKQLRLFKQEFENSKTVEEFLQVHNRYRQFILSYMTNYSLAQIRNACNTKDEFYAKEIDYLDEIMPELEVLRAEVNSCYVTSAFSKQLEQFIPTVIFKNIEMQLKANSPLIVQEKITENKLTTEYNNLMVSMSVEFEGNKIPLSKLYRYMSDDDREVRKKAVNALGKVLSDNGEKLDEIFDNLVKVRTEMGKKLGFEGFSPLGYLRMQRNCYQKEDIAKFRQNVLRYIVPLCQQLYERAKNRLKLDKQYFYDEKIFTQTQPCPQGTPQEIFENASKMYHSMDSDMGELFDRMVRCEAFDYMSRENKFGGGFCDGLPVYKIPFIFSNFNGSSDDIETLTHEFGHAYAFDREFRNDNAFLSSMGMETAEVHSMSMEFLTYPYMKMFYGDKVNDFVEYHISSALAFIPYGTIVDYFQQLCYDNADMTSSERLQLYLQLEHRFRPWTTLEGIKGIENGRYWQRQSHIFEDPFYYIDYCLAQVMALQFLSLSMEDYDKALQKYKKFVNFGGTLSFTDIIEQCQMDSPFEESTFVKIVASVKKLLKLN